MRRIISALILSISFATAQADAPLELTENAPDRHVVAKGDSLWSISASFLKEPYRWPEIWRLNKAQIKNPNRIYPGDIIVLDRSGKTPQLKLATPLKLQPRIHESDTPNPIASIPTNAIEAFLSRPLVVELGTLESAPRIIATQEDRVFLGAGDQAFVSGLGENPEQNWHIYRHGKPLKDPDTQEILGLEAFFLGTGKVVQGGEPAVLQVVTSKEEIGRGHSLLPATLPDLTAYVPHKPEEDIQGRVMTVYGGVSEAGKYSIITLNRGLREGLEIGHVLALVRQRNANFKDENNRVQNFQLPDERYGLVFVFRVFDRLSYALVVQTTRPVILGDRLVTP